MFDINVAGEEDRGVSMIYARIVGYEEAKVSRRICPDADHRKTSIWPGVSTMMYLSSIIILKGVTRSLEHVFL
jgi:hypothetical protein